MKPARRRWEVRDAVPLDGMHPVLGHLLAARGHDAASAASLISGSCDSHDPHLLRGMTEAVIAIGVAVADGSGIAVYGDYDADGVTACAMLTRALRAGGARVIPYIPHRVNEGYGLHAAALEDLARQGIECVITVDCGTSSIEVARSRPCGMKLIVTDHHLPLAPDGTPPALAPADALVNPKQPGCAYPFDGLAGAGVALKLVEALEGEAVVPPGSVEGSLGLAALGTVCDMMPLRGENRSIVSRGLKQLRKLPGLDALCRLAGTKSSLAASDLAFTVGPRINAAGRMEDAVLALNLCLSDDEEGAVGLASRLDDQNRERRAALANALEEAYERVAELPEDMPAIVVGDPGWPVGIVGLIAGRLAERYARPAFVVCLDGDEAKGSARSVPGVHIVRALDGAASTLIRYGGHVAAAGFSLQPSRFAEFSNQICAAVAAQVEGLPRERVFAIDALVRPSDISLDLCEALRSLEPCGQGNPSPLLAVEDCTVLSTSPFGVDGRHLRITLGGSDGLMEAVAFDKPQLASHLPRGRRIDICCGLEMDEWEGQTRVRARLRDLRPSRASRPLVLAQEDRLPVAVSA